MGNQLLKNYDIEKEYYIEAGFQCLWKVYYSYKLEDKSKLPYSAFVFKKSYLKGKHIPNPIKDEVFSFLKKEPQLLAKFKHPYILSISEPLVEHKKCLVYATEKVYYNVESMLKGNKISEIYQSEIEFKLHLHELIEGLMFLHTNVKMAHLNICPENIYITDKDRWKLSGFNFTALLNDERIFKENEPVLKDIARLSVNINYAAPEIYDGTNTFSFASDIFSLGVTILTILKRLEEKNETLFLNCSSIAKHKEEITAILKNVENNTFFQKMNVNLKTLLLKMINYDPNARPTIEEIQASSWLNDPLVQTLNYLDSLSQREQIQQIAFFKGFSKIITKFESKIIKSRILPRVLEFIHNDHCSSLILQIIFVLLDQVNAISKDEFMDIIWPSIKILTAAKEISAQSLLLLVNGLQRLSEYLSSVDLQKVLLPLFLKCYACGVPKLVEAMLKNTEFLVKKIEFSLIKNKILPKLLSLALEERHETRKAAIFALNKVYSIFDKKTINESILPTLEKALKKNSSDMELTLKVLEMYEGMASIVGVDGIANKILPQLIPAMSEKSIGKQEFLKRYEILQNLIKKIYDEKIKELDQISEEQTNEKKKLDKAINEIEEISKQQVEIQQSETDFDFLKIFDNNKDPKSNELIKKPANTENIPLEIKKSASESLNQINNTPLKISLVPTRNDDNIIKVDEFPNISFTPKRTFASETGKFDNNINFTLSQQKKSNNPFEELLPSPAIPVNFNSFDMNKFDNKNVNNGNLFNNTFFALNNQPPPIVNFFMGQLPIETNTDPEKCFDFVDDLINPDNKKKKIDEKNIFSAFSSIKFNDSEKKSLENHGDLI